MKAKIAALTVLGIHLLATCAWAGSSQNGGPAGDSGGSGSEPALIALILFSVIPGIYFVRKALGQRTTTAE
ncbi:MAG: hypothetical protein VX589_02220 [Myxococcota bacterium]|nr:hypothetical protein [Myxococcota bacterium]